MTSWVQASCRNEGIDLPRVWPGEGSAFRTGVCGGAEAATGYGPPVLDWEDKEGIL